VLGGNGGNGGNGFFVDSVHDGSAGGGGGIGSSASGGSSLQITASGHIQVELAAREAHSSVSRAVVAVGGGDGILITGSGATNTIAGAIIGGAGGAPGGGLSLPFNSAPGGVVRASPAPISRSPISARSREGLPATA